MTCICTERVHYSNISNISDINRSGPHHVLSFPLIPRRMLMFLNKTFAGQCNWIPHGFFSVNAKLDCILNTTRRSLQPGDLELKVAMLIPRDRNFSHDFNDPLRLECLAIRRRDKIVKPARGSALQRGNGLYFSARCSRLSNNQSRQ